MLLDDKIYIDFYEKFICFNEIIEVRIFKKIEKNFGSNDKKKGYFFSLFAKNYVEFKKILEKYESDIFNVYFGINTRNTLGKRDDDIKVRTIFYMDVESEGQKPPYEDVIYLKKLNETIDYLKKEMKERFNLDVGAIVRTGRGKHLYFKIKGINSKDTKDSFRTWFKTLEEELDKKKPYKDIKFSDSVFNVSRIASAPGTINRKYPEKPRRIIEFLDLDTKNDISDLLKDYEYDFKKKPNMEGKELNYDNKSIYRTPEFRLLKNHDDLPEGKIHTNLLFAFKLLVRDSGLTSKEELREIERNLSILGYPSEDMTPPSDEYQYSQRILINWCIENFEWCVETGYKMPYKIKAMKQKYMENTDIFNFEKRRITTYRELIDYIREFNNKTMIQKNTYQIFFIPALYKNVIDNIDKKLWKFVEMNDLWNRIKLSKTIGVNIKS